MTAKFHIAMFPWFAMGHLTPFLQLANKLAERGHQISFIVPKNTQSKLTNRNHHPDLISFYSVTVPAVDGLPLGAETTADIAGFHQVTLLLTAMDRTRPEVEKLLLLLNPQFVFLDFAYWVADISSKIGAKAIYYNTISIAASCYFSLPSRRKQLQGKDLAEIETALMEPPPGYPVEGIKLDSRQAKMLAHAFAPKTGTDLPFFERLHLNLSKSVALAYKTCNEIEGAFVDYMADQFGKPILLSGPVVPRTPTDIHLDQELANWLGKQKESSVIYCCLGSESVLEKKQFQELLLGVEQTGLPFLAALKAPPGTEFVAAALPQGFKERVGERGVVHDGWVQQQLILRNPSVGCFVTHCGWGSIVEGLTSRCQLVLLPQIPEQTINGQLIARKLKVGVEVEKGEDGLFTKEIVCQTIVTAMDVEKGVGRETRDGHERLREALLTENLEESYVDDFCKKLGLLI